MRTAYRVGAILLCTACLLAAVALQQRHVDCGEHVKLLRTLESGDEIHVYVRSYTEVEGPPEVSKRLAGKYFVKCYSVVVQKTNGRISRVIGTYHSGYPLKYPRFAGVVGVEILDAREDGRILVHSLSDVRVVKYDADNPSSPMGEWIIRSGQGAERIRSGRIVDADLYDLEWPEKSERWQLVPKTARSDDTVRATVDTLPTTVAGTPMEAKLLWSKARGEVDGPEMRMRTSTSSNSAAAGSE